MKTLVELTDQVEITLTERGRRILESTGDEEFTTPEDGKVRMPVWLFLGTFGQYINSIDESPLEGPLQFFPSLKAK